MKILLGLMAFFMLPSVTGLGSGIGNTIAAKNNTQDNVAFSPEAYHESNYYSIDLVADSSLSYPSNDVRLICRTTGYSHGVEFSVGGYYYLTSFHVLDDGTSYELRLTPRYSFENVGTTITATQYDSRSGQDIIRSEAFYSAWREDYISLSTTSMEHARDCADLAYFHRTDGWNAYKEFSTEWNRKNNERTKDFVSSTTVTWRENRTYRFYLRDENGLKPLQYVNVGFFYDENASSPEKVLMTDENGEVTSPYAYPPKYLRLMSCSIFNYYNDGADPEDPVWRPIQRARDSYDIEDLPPIPNPPSTLSRGIALYRTKDFESTLSYYYNDFAIESDKAMDFYIYMDDGHGQVSSFAKAMKIIQTLAYGNKYVTEMSGLCLQNVFSAFYPCSGERSYYKQKRKGEIGTIDNMYISEDAYSSPDVILHEFGHCVQRKFRFGSSLGVPHYLGKNNASLLGNTFDGLRLAWGEAWPSVYANLVCQEYGSYFLQKGAPLDTFFNSHNCSFDLESPNVNYGQESEEVIAAVLYDLYDSNDTIEGFDRLSCGHKGLWDLMAGAANYGNGIDTFGDFLNYYQRTRSSDEMERMQNIMREYSVAPNPRANGKGTMTSAPMLSWNSIPGANKYDVVIYNGYGTIITTRIALSNYYGIDDYDWKKVIEAPTSGWYYEIVAHVSLNGKEYSFGSGRISMTKPEGVKDGGLVTIDHSSLNRIVNKKMELKTGETMQYIFRVNVSGYTTFQTVGPYGSYMQLLDSDNNLLAVGHGGGNPSANGYYSNSRQKNAFIRYYCQANTDYIILIKDCNSGRNYHGTFIAMQEYAYTKGSSDYDSASSLQEMVTDNGFYQVDCYRQKVSIFNFIPQSSGTFTAQLVSNLDTYLYVVDTVDGEVHDDDDDGPGLNGEVSFEASSFRKYLIMVTQFNPSNDPGNNKQVKVHIWKS